MAFSERLTKEQAQQATGIDARALAGITAVRTYLRLVGPQVWKQAGQTVLTFVFSRYINRAAYDEFPEQPHGYQAVAFGPHRKVISPELRDPETDDVIDAEIAIPAAAEILSKQVDVSGVKTFGELIEAVKRETYRLTNETGLMQGTEEA